MKHILVVDDDVSIGDLLQEVLTQGGYRVSRAYSGTEALLVILSTGIGMCYFRKKDIV